MAEFSGLPIPTMDWHSPDAPQAFKKFKARCQLYFNGPLKDKGGRASKLFADLVRRRRD